MPETKKSTKTQETADAKSAATPKRLKPYRNPAFGGAPVDEPTEPEKPEA